MRHRVFGKKLSRSSKHRKALFKNLISALIIHGQIKTTEPKVKAIKGLVDKLIGRAKEGSLHSRRMIAAFLQDKKAVNKLTSELAPLFKSRTSGFTRVLRLGKRKGDNAMMVRIELVDKPEAVAKEAKKKS
jgi:large subunit ribosomal protein L17